MCFCEMVFHSVILRCSVTLYGSSLLSIPLVYGRWWQESYPPLCDVILSLMRARARVRVVSKTPVWVCLFMPCVLKNFHRLDCGAKKATANLEFNSISDPAARDIFFFFCCAPPLPAAAAAICLSTDTSALQDLASLQTPRMCYRRLIRETYMCDKVGSLVFCAVDYLGEGRGGCWGSGGGRRGRGTEGKARRVGGKGQPARC